MWKWVLQGLKPPVLAGRNIPLVKKSRGHIQTEIDMESIHLKTTKKVSMAVARCWRMYGKNWRLNPKKALWFYTTVIRWIHKGNSCPAFTVSYFFGFKIFQRFADQFPQIFCQRYITTKMCFSAYFKLSLQIHGP